MNPHDPAFPQIECESNSIRWNDHGESTDCVSKVWSEGGLSKRELFAAMAMQAIVGAGINNPKEVRFSEESVAAGAVEYADALIAELAKTEGKDG